MLGSQDSNAKGGGHYTPSKINVQHRFYRSQVISTCESWLSLPPQYRLKNTPRVLHADNEFRNTELQTLADDHGIKLVFSEPYRPWVNGSVERFNQTEEND